MSFVWGRTWSRRRWWKLALLVIVAWMCACVVGACNAGRHRRGVAGIAEQDESASVAWAPVSLWRQMSWRDLLPGRKTQVPYQVATAGDENADQTRGGADDGRKIVRMASLEIEVKDPAATMEQIRALAGRMGGYLVSSQLVGGSDAPAGSINVRVPTERLDEALKEIKKLADRVQSETVKAEDVTQNYVDREAALRNLRAEESQYLLIMKRARTVADTLDVSTKLSQVRGTIEQQQAEFLALAKQVETVAISVSLIPTAETQVFGIHWRPWFSIKLAAMDGMDGLASFARAFTAIIFLLPTILLWAATLVVCAAICVRVLRWVWRRLFVFSRSKPMETQPATTA